jgi:hypothetical protein
MNSEFTLLISRSEIDPRAYYAQRQAANGNWSRRIPFNPQFPFEFGRIGIPAAQIESVLQQLFELPLGGSLVVMV